MMISSSARIWYMLLMSSGVYDPQRGTEALLRLRQKNPATELQYIQPPYQARPVCTWTHAYAVRPMRSRETNRPLFKAQIDGKSGMAVDTRTGSTERIEVLTARWGGASRVMKSWPCTPTTTVPDELGCSFTR